MKKTYILRDGGRIAATSPTDFVRQLHAGSFFDHEGTDEEYMERFAVRLRDLNGSEVRTDRPETFLSDLLRCGFVQETDRDSGNGDAPHEAAGTR